MEFTGENDISNLKGCNMGQINVNGNNKCCRKSFGLGKALGY